jgi:hypothetical protein
MIYCQNTIPATHEQRKVCYRLVTMLIELLHFLQTPSCPSIMLSSNAIVKLVTLLVHTQEVLGSSLSLDTDYPDSPSV